MTRKWWGFAAVLTFIVVLFGVLNWDIDGADGSSIKMRAVEVVGPTSACPVRVSEDINVFSDGNRIDPLSAHLNGISDKRFGKSIDRRVDARACACRDSVFRIAEFGIWKGDVVRERIGLLHEDNREPHLSGGCLAVVLLNNPDQNSLPSFVVENPSRRDGDVRSEFDLSVAFGNSDRLDSGERASDGDNKRAYKKADFPKGQSILRSGDFDLPLGGVSHSPLLAWVKDFAVLVSICTALLIYSGVAIFVFGAVDSRWLLAGFGSLPLGLGLGIFSWANWGF